MKDKMTKKQSKTLKDGLYIGIPFGISFALVPLLHGIFTKGLIFGSIIGLFFVLIFGMIGCTIGLIFEGIKIKENKK